MSGRPTDLKTSPYVPPHRFQPMVPILTLLPVKFISMFWAANRIVMPLGVLSMHFPSPDQVVRPFAASLIKPHPTVLSNST